MPPGRVSSRAPEAAASVRAEVAAAETWGIETWPERCGGGGGGGGRAPGGMDEKVGGGIGGGGGGGSSGASSQRDLRALRRGGSPPSPPAPPAPAAPVPAASAAGRLLFSFEAGATSSPAAAAAAAAMGGGGGSRLLCSPSPVAPSSFEVIFAGRSGRVSLGSQRVREEEQRQRVLKKEVRCFFLR